MAKQAVSKPNRNSLKGLWGGTMAKQAEGCAVLRLPKRNSLYLRWGGTMAKQAEGCAMASGAGLEGFGIAESI